MIPRILPKTRILPGNLRGGSWVPVEAVVAVRLACLAGF